MLGKSVVVWPAGTSWDADRRRVVFGGDFQGSADAPVNSYFTGGGGTVDARDDRSGALGDDAEAAFRACLAHAGATHGVLAWPAS